MVLRLLAHNAEHWLSGQLNAYLRDDGEYPRRHPPGHHPRHCRAGVITVTPETVTVTLQRPAERRIDRPILPSAQRKFTEAPTWVPQLQSAIADEFAV